jgi:hypothetical protein
MKRIFLALMLLPLSSSAMYEDSVVSGSGSDQKKEKAQTLLFLDSDDEDMKYQTVAFRALMRERKAARRTGTLSDMPKAMDSKE